MATLNQIKRVGKRPYRRIGRGQSSTRGKTSGRGGKGQTARAGAKIRPALRDIIKKLPKRRGFGKNRARTVNATKARPTTVSLERLGQVFENGADVSLASLKEKGLLTRHAFGAKIVGSETDKKLTIKGFAVSAKAKAAIEKAGGTVA
jgi:large subunit ribosomal protein L15